MSFADEVAGARRCCDEIPTGVVEVVGHQVDALSDRISSMVLRAAGTAMEDPLGRAKSALGRAYDGLDTALDQIAEATKALDETVSLPVR